MKPRTNKTPGSNIQSKVQLCGEIENFFIKRESLPPFSIPQKDQPLKNIFYALLKTNENTRDARHKLSKASLKGTYVGVGFGASFQCIRHFFNNDFNHAILCDREPFVYFMGKIVIYLIRTVESPEEFFLNFVDHDSFLAAYRRALKNEQDASPLFFRKSRSELEEKIPAEINYLRQSVFSTNKDPLSDQEITYFTSLSAQTPGEKVNWIESIMATRAQYAVSWFYREFQQIKLKLRRPVTPLCVDFFDPQLWTYLAGIKELWEKPSMIYFSNAAIYAQGLSIQPNEYCVSNKYTRTLMEKIPGAEEGRHYFVYGEQRENEKRYHLKVQRHIPEEEEIVGSFAGRIVGDAVSPVK